MEIVLKMFWSINWEMITIISALNSGISMTNKQYYKLPLRSSEGIYKSVEYRKHNKATFKH